MKFNITGYFERLYSYLPNINSEVKNSITSILPALSIIFGLLITFSSVMELLGTPVISLFSTKSTLPAIQILLLTNVTGVFQGLLMVFAYSALKKKDEKGWKFIVWSQYLWILGSALTLSFSFILGLILLYPLFKVKTEYK